MKKFICYRGAICLRICPVAVRDSRVVEYYKELISIGCLFSDENLSIRVRASDFDSWVDKCLKSFAKRDKSRAVKYAPCEIVINSLLSKIHTVDEFNEWSNSNGVSDCFRFREGLHRGYATVSERGILHPLQTQTGYGFWFKQHYNTSYYCYGRLIIDLGKVDRLLQVLS